MRLAILILLLSAGSVATGQPNPPAPQSPNPTPCNSALQSFSPPSSVCIDPGSIKISVLPAPQPNQSWTGHGLPQVKPAIPRSSSSAAKIRLSFLLSTALFRRVHQTHCPAARPSRFPPPFRMRILRISPQIGRALNSC